MYKALIADSKKMAIQEEYNTRSTHIKTTLPGRIYHYPNDKRIQNLRPFSQLEFIPHSFDDSGNPVGGIRMAGLSQQMSSDTFLQSEHIRSPFAAESRTGSQEPHQDETFLFEASYDDSLWFDPELNGSPRRVENHELEVDKNAREQITSVSTEQDMDAIFSFGMLPASIWQSTLGDINFAAAPESTPFGFSTFLGEPITALQDQNDGSSQITSHEQRPETQIQPQNRHYQNALSSSPNREHRRSRMFSCDQPYCTKSFTRKYELSRHQLRHSGQRAYACSFTGCKRAGTNGFTRKDHLRQHLRQVHGI